MEYKEVFDKLIRLVDSEAKTTVGMLCKRIEVLDKNQALNANLYKDLAKETIYEQSRALKKYLEFLLIPKITFK